MEDNEDYDMVSNLSCPKCHCHVEVYHPSERLIKEYNHTSYRNGVIMAMVDKYGSKDNAIFEMQKALESLEGQANNLKKVIGDYLVSMEMIKD